jgi:hypothetical protein
MKEKIREIVLLNALANNSSELPIDEDLVDQATEQIEKLFEEELREHFHEPAKALTELEAEKDKQIAELKAENESYQKFVYSIKEMFLKGENIYMNIMSCDNPKGEIK